MRRASEKFGMPFVEKDWRKKVNSETKSKTFNLKLCDTGSTILLVLVVVEVVILVVSVTH